MTDRAALLMDLADRVEKAQGADRELDAAIFVALTPEAYGVERRPLDGLIDNDTAGWLLRWDPPRRWSDSWRPILRYTASLDAALSLVPEGWRWSLDHTQNPPYRDCGRATLYAPGDGWTPADVSEIYGATPALALCAAALRARAEEARHD